MKKITKLMLVTMIISFLLPIVASAKTLSITSSTIDTTLKDNYYSFIMNSYDDNGNPNGYFIY